MEGINREREPLKPLLKEYHRKVFDKDTAYTPAGCAFCQFGVPCMDRNPMSGKRNKESNPPS